LLENYHKAIDHKETDKETLKEFRNSYNKNNKNSLLNAHFSLKYSIKVDQDLNLQKDIKFFIKIQS
jgi:hypothetical protein